MPNRRHVQTARKGSKSRRQLQDSVSGSKTPTHDSRIESTFLARLFSRQPAAENISDTDDDLLPLPSKLAICSQTIASATLKRRPPTSPFVRQPASTTSTFDRQMLAEVNPDNDPVWNLPESNPPSRSPSNQFAERNENAQTEEKASGCAATLISTVGIVERSDIIHTTDTLAHTQMRGDRNTAGSGFPSVMGNSSPGSLLHPDWALSPGSSQWSVSSELQQEGHEILPPTDPIEPVSQSGTMNPLSVQDEHLQETLPLSWAADLNDTCKGGRESSSFAALNYIDLNYIEGQPSDIKSTSATSTPAVDLPGRPAIISAIQRLQEQKTLTSIFIPAKRKIAGQDSANDWGQLVTGTVISEGSEWLPPQSKKSKSPKYRATKPPTSKVYEVLQEEKPATRKSCITKQPLLLRDDERPYPGSGICSASPPTTRWTIDSTICLNGIKNAAMASDIEADMTKRCLWFSSPIAASSPSQMDSPDESDRLSDEEKRQGAKVDSGRNDIDAQQSGAMKSVGTSKEILQLVSKSSNEPLQCARGVEVAGLQTSKLGSVLQTTHASCTARSSVLSIGATSWRASKYKDITRSHLSLNATPSPTEQRAIQSSNKQWKRLLDLVDSTVESGEKSKHFEIRQEDTKAPQPTPVASSDNPAIQRLHRESDRVKPYLVCKEYSSRSNNTELRVNEELLTNSLHDIANQVFDYITSQATTSTIALEYLANGGALLERLAAIHSKERSDFVEALGHQRTQRRDWIRRGAEVLICVEADLAAGTSELHSRRAETRDRHANALAAAAAIEKAIQAGQSPTEDIASCMGTFDG